MPFLRTETEIYFLVNNDKVIKGFMKKWKTHMSYQKITISRVRENVNLIKDKVSESSIYYKNIETKLWNIWAENYGQCKEQYCRNNAEVGSPWGEKLCLCFFMMDR